MRRYVALLAAVLAVGLFTISCALAAKNVILMIGDGMGYQHVDAGSYFLTGAEGNLAFEQYYKCGVTTRSLNSSVTDSAAAATAMATGHKTNNNVVSQSPSGEIYETILEKAKAMGKRTGLVTLDPITGATPAAFGAHEASRSSYINIGNDYLNSSRPDLIFGGGDPARGGSSYFTASQVSLAQSLGYQTVYNTAQMNALPDTTSRALGLYAGTYMTREHDRSPSSTEPHLSQMAAKALSLLQQDSDGFFLMIESANNDHAAHENNIADVTMEMVEFHNTFLAVMTWLQSNPDTLVIVTGDHETGGLTAYNRGIGVIPTASWTTTNHTGSNVPLYATGANSDLFDSYIVGGVIDNTDIYRVMYSAFTIPEPCGANGVAAGLIGLIGIRRIARPKPRRN